MSGGPGTRLSACATQTEAPGMCGVLRIDVLREIKEKHSFFCIASFYLFHNSFIIALFIFLVLGDAEH
jgi:hypothetical protein